MFPRLAAALLLCVALTACKQDDNNAPVGQTLFAGIGDVRVIDARIVPTSDSSAQTSGGTLSYLIAARRIDQTAAAPISRRRSITSTTSIATATGSRPRTADHRCSSA